MRKFIKGERYRPIATVIKVKKDVPTVITVSGRRYVLEHKNQRKYMEGLGMEKVILTKKQADAVEYFKKEHQENLGDMSLRGFYDALRYGYEVEPEFKVGDWVIWNHENEKLRLIGQLVREEDELRVDDLKYEVPQSLPINHLRHATPQEIKQEKERRFWAKSGRGVWELKVNDVLSFKESNTTYNVEQVGHNMITASGGSRCVDYRLDQVKKLFKVACFAGDRLDV